MKLGEKDEGGAILGVSSRREGRGKVGEDKTGI